MPVKFPRTCKCSYVNNPRDARTTPQNKEAATRCVNQRVDSRVSATDCATTYRPKAAISWEAGVGSTAARLCETQSCNQSRESGAHMSASMSGRMRRTRAG